MKMKPTAYWPGAGSVKPSLSAALREERVRNLHQDAGAVAHQRIGADRAAMLEVLEDGEAVLDDPVRLASLEVDDEADAAGVVLGARIVQVLARAGRPGSAVSPSGG